MTEPEMMKTADGSETLLAAYKSELVDMAARLADSELRANQLEAQFHTQCKITAAALEERAEMAAPSTSPECDSPQLCKINRRCAGQLGTKKLCSTVAAPSTSPAFLDQFKADPTDKWPQWFKDLAVEKSASFPKSTPKALPPNDFDTRGILAKSLKCWHRLTVIEAQELVDFMRALAAPSASPVTPWEERFNATAGFTKSECMESEIKAWRGAAPSTSHDALFDNSDAHLLNDAGDDWEAAPSTSPMTDQEISDVYFGATSQSLRPADMFVVRLFAHAVEARAKAIKGGA